MQNGGKIIELRDRSGGLIFSFVISERALPETPSGPQKEQAPGKKEESAKNPEEPKMTDAQKRYLFRILAEQGREGEEAHEHLKKKIFQVEKLSDVPKFEASQAIQRLLAESKGGV